MTDRRNFLISITSLAVSAGLFADRLLTRNPPRIRPLAAFGDSITSRDYLGSSWRQFTYSGLIAGALGGEEVNLAKGGSQINLQAHLAYTYQPSPDSIMWGCFGFNDCANGGMDAVRQASYSSSLEALIAWLCAPTRIMATDMQRTGTWANNHSGLRSDLVGNTLKTTIKGSVIYVAYKAKFANSGGSFGVIVDGKQVGTVDCFQDTYPDESIPFTVGALRLELPKGEHQLEIRHSQQGAIMVDFVASNDGPNRPHFFVGNAIPMHYALNTPPMNRATPEANAAYNALTADVIAKAGAAGLHVHAVDVATGFDIDKDTVNPKLIDFDPHPNAEGHRYKLANKFLSAIKLVV